MSARICRPHIQIPVSAKPIFSFSRKEHVHESRSYFGDVLRPRWQSRRWRQQRWTTLTRLAGISTGPDEFVKLIPDHYDPLEVDGCIVIDKRDVLEQSPGLAFRAPMCNARLGEGEIDRFREIKDVGSSLVLQAFAQGDGPAAIPGGPRCDFHRGPRARNQARSITSARSPTPRGGESTALASVFCTANRARTSIGRPLLETPRRTPSSFEERALAWGRISRFQDDSSGHPNWNLIKGAIFMTALGTLCLHRGGVRHTREELATLPTPDPTDTWKPIPHYDLVSSLVEGLQKHEIVRSLGRSTQRLVRITRDSSACSIS